MGHIGDLDERILTDTKTIGDADRAIAAHADTLEALKTNHAAALDAAHKAAPTSTSTCNAGRLKELERKNADLEAKLRAADEKRFRAEGMAEGLRAALFPNKRPHPASNEDADAKRRKNADEAKERAAEAQKRAAAEAKALADTALAAAQAKALAAKATQAKATAAKVLTDKAALVEDTAPKDTATPTTVATGAVVAPTSH